MTLYDFADIAPREIVPGYFGRYLHSEVLTQGRVDITAGAVIPEHSHPHEQWTTVLTGTLELTIAGVAHRLEAGQVMHIASHERHAARALTSCQVLDVFHPPRDDYR